METLQIDEIRENLIENSVAVTTGNELYKNTLQKLFDIQGIGEKPKETRDLLVDQLRELNANITILINEQRELLEELYNTRHQQLDDMWNIK
ncbi:MAG: hypothetical protein ABSD71_03010 [Bacteroidales bacterium]|jgi:hypothetical protein